jgi:putative phosphoribosyl transferase
MNSIGLEKPLSPTEVLVGKSRLPGFLRWPSQASGLVIFAHGSGSSRLSPRNRQVAEALNRAGMATLLFDLLRPEEEAAHNRAKVFDIPLLTHRLMEAVTWVEQGSAAGVPLGFFGASTGAAGALAAAARLGSRVAAVVSRGGRPDLAGAVLEEVKAATLLIVGSEDHDVLKLNRSALLHLKCLSALETIPGASHLFPEPGAMEKVISLTAGWFERYLTNSPD